jgi:hypothetical protein
MRAVPTRNVTAVSVSQAREQNNLLPCGGLSAVLKLYAPDPIATPKTSYQVFGPNQCPTTSKEYDEICAAGVTKINNGAMIYVGAPVGVPEKLAACLMGEPQKFNKCDRPSD